MKSFCVLIIYLCLFCVREVCSLSCINNLAPTRVVASTNQEGYPPTNVIDNDFEGESRWSAKGEGVFLTFDLGASQTVCSVSVAWWQSSTRQFNYIISVSSNNVSYTQVTSGQSVSGTDTLQVYSFPQRTARYVRLTVNGNTVHTWASVVEMRVTSPGFVHPGVLVKQSQLDFIKSKIQAGAQPWTRVFNSVKNHARFGNVNFVASPVASVKCGSGSYSDANPSDPNVPICDKARDDGQTIWALTLLWMHSGDQRYATTAIRALNSWVDTLTQIQFNGAGDASASNGPLQAAWMAEMYIRSAELLRHGTNNNNNTKSGWTNSAAEKFGRWIMSVFYPHIRNGWWGGNNWDLSMLDGLISIAVFNNNQSLFDSSITLWKSHIPQYIYMTSDGPKPIVIYGSSNVDATWKNPPKYMDGLAQETCRDFPHTQMGLSAMINFAETAWIQGHSDVYAHHQNRIITSFEFHSFWLNRNNPTVPSYLCGGKVNQLSIWPTWEIFYNHYHYRAGYPLFNSTQVVNTIRNNGPYHTNLMSAWEVLTHCEVKAL